MTKLSQCAKCDYDRRICGHYKSEDDMDCPHYTCGGVMMKNKSKSDMKLIAHLAFLYVFFAVYVFIKFIHDVRIILFVLPIPLILLIIWAVIDYYKNRKQKYGRSIAPEINRQDSFVSDSRTLECSSSEGKDKQGFVHEQEKSDNVQKFGNCIEVDYKDLIENPIKVFLEEVLELIVVKEGYLDKMRYNPDFKGPVLVPSFRVAKMPVNLELWKSLMNENERGPYSRRVEWEDYLRLLKTLKELTKVDFSFPSSVQWEYATSTSDCVKMPSNENDRHWSYVSVGLFNRYKMEWCDRPEYDLPYQVLCSMGNGHEELYLFLATSDKYLEINYTKEEMDRVSALICEIPYINVINKP